jgi:hypothetical protein
VNVLKGFENLSEENWSMAAKWHVNLAASNDLSKPRLTFYFTKHKNM